MSSLVGYARVSTTEQNVSFQTSLLEKAGCVKTFVDQGFSSTTMLRPAWEQCLNYLRPNDILVVWKLDRVAGTEKHVIETINKLGEQNINIKSLSEPQIDTTTAMGKALFGIVAVFAQLRVDMIRENTLAGLANARANGRVGGRPKLLSEEKIVTARKLYKDGYSYNKIGKILGVSHQTISRNI